MIYLYKTEFGIFSISPDPKQNGRWNLCIDSLLLGNYASAELAADDVYTCSTGYAPWDEQLVVYDPEDLQDWQEVPQLQ